MHRREYQEYSDTDGKEGDRRGNPGQITTLRMAVNKKAERKKARHPHGSIQTDFWQDSTAVDFMMALCSRAWRKLAANPMIMPMHSEI